MKSFWQVTYVGSHTNIFIKKFERFLGQKALEVQRERYVWEEQKLERAEFLMEHECESWPLLCSELIRISSKVGSEWKMSANFDDVIHGHFSAEKVFDGAPKGIRSLGWALQRDQDYQRNSFNAGRLDWAG